MQVTGITVQTHNEELLQRVGIQKCNRRVQHRLPNKAWNREVEQRVQTYDYGRGSCQRVKTQECSRGLEQNIDYICVEIFGLKFVLSQLSQVHKNGKSTGQWAIVKSCHFDKCQMAG